MGGQAGSLLPLFGEGVRVWGGGIVMGGRFPDCIQYAICLHEHFPIGKAQRPDAFVAKESSACRVAFAARVAVVLATIQLDGKSQLRAVKIQNIRRDGMLTPKLAVVHPSITQTSPHQSLRIRGILAE